MKMSGTVLGLGAVIVLGSLQALAQNPVQAVPEIRLPPAAPDAAPPAFAPETPATPAPLAVPEPRDHAALPQRGNSPLPLLPLLVGTALPESVQMGASLPEPGILRLTGEVAQIALTLNLPPAGVLPDEIVLAQRSSINILPETARLQVSINDSEPLPLPLENLGNFGALSLPGSGLQPGRNTLKLTLHQPHRIYCGPDASFAVWTEFDLGQSGAHATGGGLTADAAGFAMAVANQLGSGRPLRISAEDDADPALLRRLAAEFGRATKGTGQIEISSFYAMGPAPAAAIALIASDRNSVSYRQGARGGLVMQIEHLPGTLPDLTVALQDLSVPGVAAAVPMLPADTAMTFRELGQGDVVGNTHYFRSEVPFALPADWLLLANQKARLVLNYGFADDLTTGSILLVKVNDETVQLLPLDRNGGQMQPAHTISFGARLLHAGVNKISFEMMVPGDPPDAACVPRSTDMLVIGADSSLIVPGSPSMQLAGLTAPLAGLTAEAITLPSEVPPAPKMENMAIRLAAGLRPSDVADPRNSLTLVDLEQLPLMPLDRQRLPLAVVQRTLLPMPAVTGLVADAPTAPTYRFSEQGDRVPATEAEPGWSDRLYQGVPDLFGTDGWLARQSDRLASLAFLGSDQSLASWLDGRQGSALLLRPVPEEPGRMWLILGPGADARTVSQGLNSLRDTRLGEGEAALLRADGGWDLWTPVRLPILHEDVQPSNLLSVLGNYASWSPLIFATGLIGAALLSALPALVVVVLYRRRRLR